MLYKFFQENSSGYGSDIENICIDLFYSLKLSACQRKDCATIKKELNLDEAVSICHVDSKWLPLLLAVESIE